MKYFFKTSFVLLAKCIFLLGCTLTPLENALELSGNNRQELEKVLNYFSSKDPPLKLEVAQYLIENMPEHYSFASETLNKYYNYIDSSFPNTLIITDATSKQYHYEMQNHDET